MQNLLDDLTELLARDQRFVSDGKMLKNKVIESALNLDADLLELLLQNESIKDHFFVQAGDILVFDKIKFQKFVSNKQFLPDSYTAFKNKIGLTTGDDFISDKKEVVLSWPYKDCVLEGGQTKEDQKRTEVFWNETLAPDEIDRLLSPKVFTNFRRYTKNGEEQVLSFSGNDNYIIKGNNLLVLHSLARVKAFKAKVKLIYIDPPYNTGNDGFNYNDAFNYSSWLSFMKNRLSIAKELLSDDGSLWINIDDKMSHYLKVLCDEIFGIDNFVINFIWQKKYSPANDAKWFSDTHDHILVFAKDKKSFVPNLLPRTEEMNKRYSNPDNDPRGDWKPGGFSVKTYSKDYDYPIETPSGKIVYPPKGSCWQTSKENYLKKLNDNRIYFGPNGDSKPQLKQFLSEVQQGVVAKSIWTYDEVGHNQISRSEITKLFGEFLFATPKPEKLMKRVVELSTKEGDMVLDFFSGSGTTAAVAHKMNRRYIGIEQMDYIKSVVVERLKKVIAGEKGGVSALLNWQGGGSFVYTEMLESIPFNLLDVKKLNEDELKNLFYTFAQSNFGKYYIDNIHSVDFDVLTLTEKRKIVLEIIDKNQLYVPLSEIKDSSYSVDEHTIALNVGFYKL